MTNEPGTVANGVVGGITLIALVGPLQDLLTELGASPRLATAIVAILMWAASFGAALWARSRTVTTRTVAATAAVALALPASADTSDLNVALEKKALPPVEAT
jgi:hypothetical protein